MHVQVVCDATITTDAGEVVDMTDVSVEVTKTIIPGWPDPHELREWTAEWVQPHGWRNLGEVVTISTQYGTGRAGIMRQEWDADGMGVTITAQGYGPFEPPSASNAAGTPHFDDPDGVEVFDGPDHRSRRVPTR